MTRRLLLACALPALLLPPFARAGIVVLHTGRAIVGRIDPVRDVTPEGILVRAPEGERGEIAVERHRVRWFDAQADAPTPAYFERFRAEPLESRWDALAAAWDASRRPVPEDPVPLPPPPRELLGPAVRGPHFTLEPPLGWTGRVVEGITILEGEAGRAGYAPRIHLFAVETPGAAEGDPARWVEEELRALPGTESFALEELSRPLPRAGGSDQELLTRTRAGGREVRALRRVCLRPGWTVVATAYADSAEWDLLLPLLRRSLDTLVVRG